MHRDWDTLIEAVRDWSQGEVRIASKTIRRRQSWPDNVVIVRPETAQEIIDLYDWADIVVVALKRNLHASGITVIVEAVSFGLPIVCTDTGGLRAYFNEQEIRFVAPRNPQAIRKNIEELAADDELRFKLTVRAQRRMLRDELTSYAYAIRHRKLSETLLHLPAESS
jgi:glycosyltransferase involved in cell wall biosynthesis